MDLTVIIPFGPGHTDLHQRATSSVKIAIATGAGPFTDVRIMLVDDSKGEKGRSEARNEGVGEATTEWLFFLDADDLMHPEALINFGEEGSLYDAVWGLTTELVDGNVLTRYQVPVLETYRDLIGYDPFMTVKMGHFVKRRVALANLFNTALDCGEDWDYYLRVWKRYECRKVNRPFFIKIRGEHSTGPRSATGRDWNQAVDKLIDRARAEYRVN